MKSFYTTSKPSEYKRENYFPGFNKEYYSCIGRELLLLKKRLGMDEPSAAECLGSGFKEEEPIFNAKYPNVRPLKTDQNYNFASTLSSRVDHLIRFVSDGDTSYELQRVDQVKETLKDKDLVLIVCAFVPAKWCDYDAEKLCQLSLISSELLSNSSFEMVIVPKMRKRPDMGGHYGVDDFLNFFSAFPGRLSLPSTNHEACDYFCKRFNFKGHLTCALVSRDKVVEVDAWNSIQCFGSAGFPFTRDRLRLLEDELPRLPLPDLLGLKPPSKLMSLDRSSLTTVEDLSDKVVGIYLFCRGENFKVYDEVYKQCRGRDGKESQFEIVLICQPPLSCIHPYAHQHEVFSTLTQLGLGNSFWFMEYDNSACLRLSKLSCNYDSDALIIVGPESEYMEPYGGEILAGFGMDAFPFHREALLQRYVAMLEAVTLQSLLSRKSVQYVVTPDKKQMPIAELQGKNVVLYADYVEDPSRETFEMVHKWCKEMEKQSIDFVVVYIRLCSGLNGENMVETPFQDAKWLEYPSDSEHTTRLEEHEAFFFAANTVEPTKPLVGFRPPEVLLFGKDGRIHMIDAAFQIGARPKVNLFHPDCKDLRAELIHKFKDYFEFFYEYYD